MSGYNDDGIWEEDSSMGEQVPVQDQTQQVDTSWGNETNRTPSFGGSDSGSSAWDSLFGSGGIFSSNSTSSGSSAPVAGQTSTSDGMPRAQDFIESLQSAAGIGKDLIGSLFGDARSGKLTIRDLASGVANAYAEKSKQDSTEKQLNLINQQKIDSDNRQSASIKGLRTTTGIVQAAKLKRNGGTAVFQSNGKVS